MIAEVGHGIRVGRGTNCDSFRFACWGKIAGIATTITGSNGDDDALIDGRSYGIVHGRTESATKTHVCNAGRFICSAAGNNVINASNNSTIGTAPRATEDLDCAQFAIFRNTIIGAACGSRNMRPDEEVSS